jgi:hypothetical protein
MMGAYGGGKSHCFSDFFSIALTALVALGGFLDAKF